MVKTGIPFMLNDRTGSLSGSEFVDLYDRIYLRVCCTHRDSNGASEYGMYNMLARHHEIPVATFQYGAGGALGNITFISSEGSMRTQAMAAFLVEVGGPRHRKFTASDGREYSWSWRTSTQEDLEWSCVNANGHTVAWYAVSSGHMFGVEEPYPHLAIDFLATLMIMRHIAARNT
ncbi:hypothetical protein DFH94DRAFT_638665 [Russula ochroleuca]|jgi:hypothetical protein|uniref:DUF6593 domain-containing protein n=1 Tax=Russula ochroleuca TaxID=152965 RepID=A0A9P5JW32_9AGAM|nr:hypothetical protein DFH94DRAFT_638665 [Russula ochroleuca]